MMDMKFVFAIVLIGAIVCDAADDEATTLNTIEAATTNTTTAKATTTTPVVTTAAGDTATAKANETVTDANNMAMDAVPVSPISYLLTAALTVLFAVKA
jgi:hypothetical protein